MGNVQVAQPMPIMQTQIPIVQVDSTRAMNIGIAVAVVIFLLSAKYVYQSKDPNMDASGCTLDVAGARVRAPIYATRTVRKGNTWVTESTGQITGYDECVEPTPKPVQYAIAAALSAFAGLVVGGIIYSVQFDYANPQLAAQRRAQEAYYRNYR